MSMCAIIQAIFIDDHVLSPSDLAERPPQRTKRPDGLAWQRWCLLIIQNM